MWLAIRKCLPVSDHILKRHGTTNAACSLCGENKDMERILFRCVLAKFAWSCIGSWMNVNWDPNNFCEHFNLVRDLTGQRLHVFWTAFASQCWSLWTTCNKFTIQHSYPRKPANCLFKLLDLLQRWKPLIKEVDVATFDSLIADIQRTATTLLQLN